MYRGARVVGIFSDGANFYIIMEEVRCTLKCILNANKTNKLAEKFIVYMLQSIIKNLTTFAKSKYSHADIKKGYGYMFNFVFKHTYV